MCSPGSQVKLVSNSNMMLKLEEAEPPLVTELPSAVTALYLAFPMEAEDFLLFKVFSLPKKECRE